MSVDTTARPRTTHNTHAHAFTTLPERTIDGSTSPPPLRESRASFEPARANRVCPPRPRSIRPTLARASPAHPAARARDHTFEHAHVTIMASDDEVDLDLDFAKKKKSKKKVQLDLGSDDDAVDAAREGVSALDLDDDDGEVDFGKKKKKKSKEKAVDVGAGEDEGDAGDLEAEFGKKKKKSGKKKKALDVEDEDEASEMVEGRDGTHTGSGTSWDGTTRDYHYDELLGRVFGILREKNPALSEKSKTIVKPPQVLREGTKKTVFANLMEICNGMHRAPEHVIQYLLAELGTTGTLDGQQRLVLKGRFLPKAFEGVLRHYFIDYVICNMCKSSDTQLIKEQASRLTYCRCQACGASRSVSGIQKGFAATMKGERRKARNATG